MAIILLDESVANKIAAGEVIERPASVVKELVENSLDAGAARIEVEVEQAGRRLIQVTDNGEGMARQDAVLSLQRHATSKISREEDLAAISTLGFRGEALPSIAAVSRLRIATRRPQDQVGAELVAEAGAISDLREVGIPPGTRVTVERLFFNTPARLKFLKSEAAEMGQITDLIGRFTLSHHWLSFRLLHQGREVISRAGSDSAGSGQSLLASIGALFGRSVADQMMPLELELPPLRISGFISKPQLARAGRSNQVVFINRRWVRSRLIGHALEEAYHGMLPAGRFPVAVVMIEIEPGLVDVNVHPTKAEVRFSGEGEIWQAVNRAAREALGSGGLAGQAILSRPPLPGAPARRDGGYQPESRPVPAAFQPALPIAPALEGLEGEPGRPAALAQLRRTYLLAEDGGGMVVVDQHRAHERVLFTRLSSQAAGSPDRQPLVIPSVLHFSAQESEVLKQHLETFISFGFELEPFGADSFQLRAVPAMLAGKDAEQAVRELVEQLLSSPAPRRLDQIREQLIATMACKSAVKAGDPLDRQEMQALLDALWSCPNRYTCPHGAPVVLTIGGFELDRKFHR